MAAPAITVNQTSAGGPAIKSAVNGIASQQAQWQRLLYAMQGYIDFGASDYTALETYFGIPTGKGSTIYGYVFALADPSTGALFDAATINVLKNIG